MTDKRGPGRPRKAKPIRTKEGHSARIWVEREGEKVRATVKLGTASKVVATARSKRLLRGEAPELLAEKSESFESAARRLLEMSAIKDKKKMLGRLINHAFPVIGAIAVSELTSVHILDVLEDTAEKVGGWTGSVRNVRDAVSKVLGALCERRVLDVNEALRIKLKGKDSLGGRRLKKVRPPRAVLSDGEFGLLIAFLAEQTSHRFGWRRRQGLEYLALYLSARVFGMRSSDAFAWRWEMVCLDSFADAYVPRPKTDAELLDELGEEDDGQGAILEAWRDEPRSAVPEALRGWLRLWWLDSGSPSEGPVFPVRKGKRAGEKKKAGAHALRLRQWLWAAGVTRARPGVAVVAEPGDCVLQSGIPRRRSATDFHSLRRATATATGKAVVNREMSLREAMAVTHHSDVAEYAKYQAREERIVVPESAVPTVVAAPTALFQTVKCQTQPKTAAIEEEAMDGTSGRPTRGPHHALVSPGFSHTSDPPNDTVTPRATTERQNSLPLFETLDQVLALAVQRAMSEGDMASAKALLDVAERRRATLPDNVRPLDAARKGKS